MKYNVFTNIRKMNYSIGKKTSLLIALFCQVGIISTTSELKAQDIHFTMYDAMIMTTNPATAGVFNGDFRSVLNYRSQWGSISNPYRTYAIMFDGGLLKNKWKNGYIGTGISAFKDVAGTTNFGTTKINLALSSVLFLDDKNSASVGLMGSWGQTSMSPDNLEWDSQFNGQNFDASLSSNELFAFENSNFFDFSAGALWSYGKGAKTLSSQDEFNIQSGVAFYHITRPNQQLEFGDVDKLYSKLAFHTEAHIGVSNSKLAFRPKFLAYLQGPTRQLLGGLMVRYTLQEESKYTGAFKGAAISLGTYYRFGDAFAPAIELEIAGFSLGFAYDLNVSGLTAASNGKGGPEVFIRFINPNPFVSGKGTKSRARFN